MALDESEFSHPQPNLIVSRNGFTVEVKMPSSIQYTEADRQMQIFAEILASAEPRIAVRRQDLKAWASPHVGTKVSEADRARVLANIQRAFQFGGWVLAIE